MVWMLFDLWLVDGVDLILKALGVGGTAFTHSFMIPASTSIPHPSILAVKRSRIPSLTTRVQEVTSDPGVFCGPWTPGRSGQGSRDHQLVRSPRSAFPSLPESGPHLHDA